MVLLNGDWTSEKDSEGEWRKSSQRLIRWVGLDVIGLSGDSFRRRRKALSNAADRVSDTERAMRLVWCVGGSGDC